MTNKIDSTAVNPRKRKLEEPHEFISEFYDETTEKVDWKKLKADRKDVKLKRKVQQAGGNELFMLSAEAKIHWEQLRRSDCKQSDKLIISSKLHELIKGKIKTLIRAHDTVRVIETLLSSGGEEIRAQVFTELENELLDLCKCKYAKFFITKMLRCGTKAQKSKIIESMVGRVARLMRHKEACDVVEMAYNNYANATQRSSMIQEFFGPRFRHFKEEISTLQEALDKHPDTKDQIISDLHRNLQPILDKGVFTNTMIHALLKEFLAVCGKEEKSNVIECLKEKLSPILHTRDGSRVAMMCLWYGTPKDRKFILKAMKSFFVKIACEEHGHMVLLAAFDCVDDTVFVSRAVIQELMDNIDALLASESGIKVLKYLMSPRDRLFFHPDITKVLQKGDENGNTKKNMTQIHKELKQAVNEPILKLVLENVTTWAKDTKWTLFIGAALKNLSGPLLEPIFEKLAEVCCESCVPGTGEGHFLDLNHTSKLVCYVVVSDKERAQAELPIFSKILLDTCESEILGWTLTNRGCFLLVKIIETEIEELKQKVIQVVKPVVSKLQKKTYPGAKILIEKVGTD